MESLTGDRQKQARSAVYHRLYQLQAPCTRQELAQDLGLSLPTIYQNLAELAEEGLVRYTGHLPSTGGRKAANAPFGGSSDYLQLGLLRGHTVPLGASLHFIRKFLDAL